jgi:hypothetical protein
MLPTLKHGLNSSSSTHFSLGLQRHVYLFPKTQLLAEKLKTAENT